MHDIIEKRRSRMSPAQTAKRTEVQNAARERKRIAESQGLADNRYTAEDQPEVSLQVIIIDHRLDKVIEADFFKTGRIDSYHVVVDNEIIGKHGAARGIREVSKLIDRIRVVE